MKINAKQIGLTVLLGSAVVVLGPMIGGIIPDMGVMSTTIIEDRLTVGAAIGAGVAAFGVDLAITKWLR